MVNIEGLTENEDFEVEYYDNVEPGTEAVVVNGIGDYFGRNVVYFEITHDIVEHEANAPACTADGNNAYWVCNTCKKVYSD